MRTLLAEPYPPFFSSAETINRPRLGLFGVHESDQRWLETLVRSDAAEIIAVAQDDAGTAQRTATFPTAAAAASFEDLLEVEVDGVVIATPGALPADSAVIALERGLAVFLQQPPSRSMSAIHQLVDAARETDRLLAVDLPFRFIPGLRRIHELCRRGELGDIYAADLAFHAGRRLDKSLSEENRLAQGCLSELGVQLLDLALWNLDFPHVAGINSRLFAGGVPIHHRGDRPEDYAEVRFDTSSGATIRLACSSKLSGAGNTTVSGSFHGTKGTAIFRNLNGSLFAFVAEHLHNDRRESLSSSEPGCDCAVVDWARRLGRGETFDPDIQKLRHVSQALEDIYVNAFQETAIHA